MSLPGSAEVQVAPTPRFYRWTFASMWTPGPFETRPLRAYYYITDADPAWPRRAAGRTPARLQLRRALGHLHPRGLSRPLPALSAPAPGDRRRFKKSILFSSTAMVEGWAHYSEQMMVDAGFRKQDPAHPARPARRSADPPLPAHRRHPPALRRSVGRAGRPFLPRRGASRRGRGAAGSRARHLRSRLRAVFAGQADGPEAARRLQGAQGRQVLRRAPSTTPCSATGPCRSGCNGICCWARTMGLCWNKNEDAPLRIRVRSLQDAFRADPEVLGSESRRLPVLRQRSNPPDALVSRDPVQGIGVLHHRLREEVLFGSQLRLEVERR